MKVILTIVMMVLLVFGFHIGVSAKYQTQGEGFAMTVITKIKNSFLHGIEDVEGSMEGDNRRDE